MIQEKAEGSSKASYDLVSGVAHRPFCHILFLRSKRQSLAHTRGGGEWSFPLEGCVRGGEVEERQEQDSVDQGAQRGF